MEPECSDVSISSVIALVIVVAIFVVVAWLWGLRGFFWIVVFEMVLGLVTLGQDLALWLRNEYYCVSYGERIINHLSTLTFLFILLWLLRPLVWRYV